VSFPGPTQVLVASLAAAPRCEGDAKPSLELPRTRPASVVDGVLLEDAYVRLVCETGRIVDGFGRNSLVTGRVLEAHVAETVIRRADRDDQRMLFEAPLLAYLTPVATRRSRRPSRFRSITE